MEIPEEGGLSDGAVEIGPVFEAGLGSWNWVGNALVEIPLEDDACLLYTSPSPRDKRQSRMPSSA